MGTYEELRALIVAGDVPAGAPVPEVTLAQRLSVSRTPVREALRRLEGDGLVEAGGRGVRVAVLHGAALRHVFEMRAALEAWTAETAARRHRGGLLAPADLVALDRLADVTDEATRAGALRDAVGHNRRFHRRIAELADNPVALDMLDRLWDRIVVSTRRSLAAPARTEAVDAEHRALLARLRDGDGPGAAAAARAHALGTLAAVTTPDP